MFCGKCGKEVPKGNKFCEHCGTKVNKEEVLGGGVREVKIEDGTDMNERESLSSKTREKRFDGELHKCPNCGEVLKSFTAFCPSCQYEIRKDNSASKVKVFAEEILKARRDEDKIDLIVNFICPNTREALYEFFLLATSNASVEENDEVFTAWKVKIDESYDKAELLFKGNDELEKINEMYSEMDANFKERKKRIEKRKFWSANSSKIIIVGLLIIGCVAAYITKFYYIIAIAVFLGFLIVMSKDSKKVKKKLYDKNDAASRISKKDRNVALILCVVLGMFGIHRYYVGKYITGTLYLLTLGLFGLGWIIDIIRIILGDFTDFTDRYLI